MDIKALLRQADSLGFERNGHLGYLVYQSLPEIPKIEWVRIARKTVRMLGSNSQISNFAKYKQHLETSFMRKLFGLTERNGAVLDVTHPKRSDGLQKNVAVAQDWSLAFEFVEVLLSEIIRQDKKIGLILLFEQLGHRHGDLAVLAPTQDEKDKEIELMRESYLRSCEEATKVKCAKQMFVVWFWMACYYHKLNLQDECLEATREFHEGFERHLNTSRVFYKDKLKISLRILRKRIGRQSFKTYKNKWAGRVKDKRLQKAIKWGK